MKRDVPLNEAWPILVLAGIVLLAQGTLLFLDARKRGGMAWFWGLWGMINFPLPSIVYFILRWRNDRKKPQSGEPTEE